MPAHLNEHLDSLDNVYEREALRSLSSYVYIYIYLSNIGDMEATPALTLAENGHLPLSNDAQHKSRARTSFQVKPLKTLKLTHFRSAANQSKSARLEGTLITWG